MTHQDWLTLLGPLLAALVLAAASIVTAVTTGITGQIKLYLDAKGQAGLSQVVTDASTRVLNAAQNEAGRMALEIGAGTLDVTNMAALKARAAAGEAAIKAKLPQAVEVLQPVQNAIAEAIIGKLGTLTMTAPTI